MPGKVYRIKVYLDDGTVLTFDYLDGQAALYAWDDIIKGGLEQPLGLFSMDADYYPTRHIKKLERRVIEAAYASG